MNLDTLFQSVKNQLTQESTNSGSPLYKEVLKLEAGKVYHVRILPNLKDQKNTFFHYTQFNWVSVVDGKNQTLTSPSTFGARCPFTEYRAGLYRAGNKEAAKKITQSDKWLVNVYVIDDPTNKENNGKVKILRYGKQIKKKIDDAIFGIDADEFGKKIFDISPAGVTLRIRVEENKEGYPSYTESKFVSTSTGAITSSEESKKIYESVHDLTKVVNVPSYEKALEILNTTVTGTQKPAATTPTAPTANVTTSVVTQEVVEETVPTPVQETPDTLDPEIKKLLDELDK